MKARLHSMKDTVLQMKDRGKRPLIQSDGEVLRFTLSGNSVAIVYKGDLLQCRVEAIVCCEHSSFIGTGRLVSEIIRLGGEEYNKYRQQKVTDQKGEVRTCRAGAKLLCKYVMHAASVTFDREGQKEAEVALMNLYDSVFKEADRKKVRTLAIPLIGAGDSGFRADVCARILVETLKTLSADSKWLPKEIHLVNNRKDTTALIIQEIILQITNVHHSVESLSRIQECGAACATPQSRSSDGYTIPVTPNENNPEELRRRRNVCDPNVEERHSHFE